MSKSKAGVFVKIPVILASDFSVEEYLNLREFAYGCNEGSPDGGFSFLVSSDSLKTIIEDTENDIGNGHDLEVPKWVTKILSQLPEEDCLFLVLCSGDSDLILGLEDGH